MVKASLLLVFVEDKHCLEGGNRAKAKTFQLNAALLLSIIVYKPKSNCFFRKLFVYNGFRLSPYKM